MVDSVSGRRFRARRLRVANGLHLVPPRRRRRVLGAQQADRQVTASEAKAMLDYLRARTLPTYSNWQRAWRAEKAAIVRYERACQAEGIKPEHRKPDEV